MIIDYLLVSYLYPYSIVAENMADTSIEYKKRKEKSKDDGKKKDKKKKKKKKEKEKEEKQQREFWEFLLSLGDAVWFIQFYCVRV